MGLEMNIIAMVMRPQVTAMRLIHTLAPILCRIRLLGTSRNAYVMKNRPAPSPYAAALIPASISSAFLARPTLVRSTKAMK